MYKTGDEIAYTVTKRHKSFEITNTINLSWVSYESGCLKTNIYAHLEQYKEWFGHKLFAFFDGRKFHSLEGHVRLTLKTESKRKIQQWKCRENCVFPYECRHRCLDQGLRVSCVCLIDDLAYAAQARFPHCAWPDTSRFSQDNKLWRAQLYTLRALVLFPTMDHGR